MSMPQFAKNFREAFPDMGASNRFLDPLLSLAAGAPRLDVVALDDALIAKHGEYEGSMREFVARQYGPKAVAFIFGAIGPGDGA